MHAYVHAFTYILNDTKVAEARARHWATAGTVLIEGATVLNSGLANGAFDVAERPDNEPPIYRRADGRDWWLFVNKDDEWAVGDGKNKDARKTSSRCTAYSMEAADGRLPHEVGAAWNVYIGKELIEQQLKMLHGHEAQAAIAEVCVYVRTHECTQVHTNVHTCMRVHARTEARVCTHTRTHARTHMQSHITHAGEHAGMQYSADLIAHHPYTPPSYSPPSLGADQKVKRSNRPPILCPLVLKPAGPKVRRS